MTEMLDPFILQVVTLKGPTAVVVFLIFLGYACKMISWLPNKYIPLINFTVGPLITPVMVGWPMPGSMPPEVRWPELAAWCSSVMAGFLLACIAWIMHAKFLSKVIDDKVPALNPGRTQEETKSTATHTDEEGKKTVTEETKTTVDVEPAPEIPPTIAEVKAEVTEQVPKKE